MRFLILFWFLLDFWGPNGFLQEDSLSPASGEGSAGPRPADLFPTRIFLQAANLTIYLEVEKANEMDRIAENI